MDGLHLKCLDGWTGWIGLMDERWTQRVVESGLAESTKIESLKSDIEEWGNHPGSFMMIPCGEAIGWKE